MRFEVATSPLFCTWEKFLVATPRADILAWCSMKARRANRKRLLSPEPTVLLRTADVLAVLTAAEGRCCYCGSLCVERRPSATNGGPVPWEHVGRRIGSLGHIRSRITGGDNDSANLSWECLWCNTWSSERRYGATDHGGIQTGRITP